MPATDLSTRLFDYAQFSNHGSNMDPWFANQKGIMPRSMSAGMLLKEAMKRDERRPRPTDYHVGYNKEKPYASRKIGPFIPFEGRPEDKVAPRYALGFRENGGEMVNVVGPTARSPAPRGVNAVLRERLPRDAPINAASVRPDSKHGPGDYDPPIPGRAARAPTLYRTPRSGKVGGGNKLQAQVPPVGAYFLPFEPGQVRVIPGIPNAPGHHGRRFQRLPEGEVGGADGEGGDIFGPSPSTPMNVGPGAYNVADSFDRTQSRHVPRATIQERPREPSKELLVNTDAGAYDPHAPLGEKNVLAGGHGGLAYSFSAVSFAKAAKESPLKLMEPSLLELDRMESDLGIVREQIFVESAPAPSPTAAPMAAPSAARRVSSLRPAGYKGSS